MDVYKFINIGNDDILLSKINIDLNLFRARFHDNGDILLQKKSNYTITDSIDLKKYNFQNSIILSCTLNNQPCSKLKYKSILVDVYNLISDGTKIIKNSKLNIKTLKKRDQGFYFIESLGISVQGVDSNKCMNEIINQVIENKIKISMFIKLDDSIVEVVF